MNRRNFFKVVGCGIAAVFLPKSRIKAEVVKIWLVNWGTNKTVLISKKGVRTPPPEIRHIGNIQNASGEKFDERKLIEILNGCTTDTSKARMYFESKKSLNEFRKNVKKIMESFK